IMKIQGMEGLVRLHVLDLKDNPINKLEGLESNFKLGHLFLDSNPLSKKERSIYKKGVKAVIEYCKSQIRDKNNKGLNIQ
ncbi:MAG: hypothetical protein ACFFDN_32845, partial [Candidatus Hodarchaeota archaeon]